MTPFRLYPSLFAADLACLGEQAKSVLKAGAHGLHLDIMDFHYVPNLSFGPEIVKALKNFGINTFLDVHLMVEPVDEMIKQLIELEVQAISFHPEASKHVDRSLQLIKSAGIKAGVALNPATPLNYLDYILSELDFILVMAVNPGFSEQKFIKTTYQKLLDLQEKIKTQNKPIEIALDGGVNLENISNLMHHGVSTFVAGSAIFNQKEIPEKNVAKFLNYFDQKNSTSFSD